VKPASSFFFPPSLFSSPLFGKIGSFFCVRLFGGILYWTITTPRFFFPPRKTAFFPPCLRYKRPKTKLPPLLHKSGFLLLFFFPPQSGGGHGPCPFLLADIRIEGQHTVFPLHPQLLYGAFLLFPLSSPLPKGGHQSILKKCEAVNSLLWDQKNLSPPLFPPSITFSLGGCSSLVLPPTGHVGPKFPDTVSPPPRKRVIQHLHPLFFFFSFRQKITTQTKGFESRLSGLSMSHCGHTKTRSPFFFSFPSVNRKDKFPFSPFFPHRVSLSAIPPNVPLVNFLRNFPFWSVLFPENAKISPSPFLLFFFAQSIADLLGKPPISDTGVSRRVSFFLFVVDDNNLRFPPFFFSPPGTHTATPG